MKITPQQTEKLLKGNHKFSQLGFSLLLTRLKGVYTKTPTPETLKACNVEMNAFLGKFQSIMSADYAIIAKL